MQNERLLEPMYWGRDPNKLPPVNNPHNLPKYPRHDQNFSLPDINHHASQRGLSMRGPIERPPFRAGHANYPDYGPDNLSQFGREMY
jgi:hypothetical protein